MSELCHDVWALSQSLNTMGFVTMCGLCHARTGSQKRPRNLTERTSFGHSLALACIVVFMQPGYQPITC
jgi:hypothetical protein